MSERFDITDCFWPTGCANSRRCSKLNACIARWQNANKDKLFPEQGKSNPKPKPITITEDPMKTLVREVIAEGRDKKEFKRSVRRHLIKTTTNTREITSMRIKEFHKRIDWLWKQIESES